MKNLIFEIERFFHGARQARTSTINFDDRLSFYLSKILKWCARIKISYNDAGRVRASLDLAKSFRFEFLLQDCTKFNDAKRSKTKSA